MSAMFARSTSHEVRVQVRVLHPTRVVVVVVVVVVVTFISTIYMKSTSESHASSSSVPSSNESLSSRWSSSICARSTW